MKAPRFLLLSAWLFSSGNVLLAQSDRKDPAAVVELGTAGSWNFHGESSYGATAAVEVTPIERWLELEAGVTSLFRRHATEWGTDLLFKKPWTLSRKVEFMFGVGPEWIHTRESGRVGNAGAGEAVLDFMFWPSAKHKFGWYLEPSYEYKFGRVHERSAGMSAGLLIAIP